MSVTLFHVLPRRGLHRALGPIRVQRAALPQHTTGHTPQGPALTTGGMGTPRTGPDLRSRRPQRQQQLRPRASPRRPSLMRAHTLTWGLPLRIVRRRRARSGTARVAVGVVAGEAAVVAAVRAQTAAQPRSTYHRMSLAQALAPACLL